MIFSNGVGDIYTTDFNLSTGILHYEAARSDTDEVLKKRTKKIQIRPLPKLQHFVPLEKTYKDVDVIY